MCFVCNTVSPPVPMVSSKDNIRNLYSSFVYLFNGLTDLFFFLDDVHKTIHGQKYMSTFRNKVNRLFEYKNSKLTF